MNQLKISKVSKVSKLLNKSLFAQAYSYHILKTQVLSSINKLVSNLSSASLPKVFIKSTAAGYLVKVRCSSKQMLAFLKINQQLLEKDLNQIWQLKSKFSTTNINLILE